MTKNYSKSGDKIKDKKADSCKNKRLNLSWKNIFMGWVKSVKKKEHNNEKNAGSKYLHSRYLIVHLKRRK